MKGSKALLVCGNLNIDRIYSVPYLPKEGQSTPIGSFREEFGGCGGNISIGAALLGVRVYLSSVVGSDFDARYRERLLDAGVDLSTLVVREDAPSPYCIILSTPEGGQCYAFSEGAMAHQKDLPVPAPGSDIALVHIATSHPDFALRTARAYHAKGAEVSLDPGQEIFFRWSVKELSSILPNSSRFFGNVREWTELGRRLGWKGRRTKVASRSFPVFEEAFETLSEAVVTMGGDGACLIDGKEVDHIPAFPGGKVVDATGAGDAFRAGFYAAKLRGMDSGKALRIGNVMGAIAVRTKGPQVLEISWERLLGDAKD